MRKEVLALIKAGIMLNGTNAEHAAYQAQIMLEQVELEAIEGI